MTGGRRLLVAVLLSAIAAAGATALLVNIFEKKQDN